MSNFGTQREASDGGVREVYTGVENFRVLAVNPDHAKLKELYGENAKEDNYLGENEVNGQKYPQLRIVLHCDNAPEEGEAKITCRPTFWITKTQLQSQTGKTQYINVFGQTMWLTPEQAAMNAQVPFHENIGPNGSYRFDTKGARPSLRGEEEFISFFRALLNLPSPAKAANPMEAASQFDIEDWNKMFNGDYKVLSSIIASTNNKVGFLLGAKRADDKLYQDVFTRSVLRQYGKNSGKFDYLLRDLDSAKENGAYPNTDFGPRDCKLRVYNSEASPTQADAFAQGSEPSSSASFFDAAAAKAFAGS